MSVPAFDPSKHREVSYEIAYTEPVRFVPACSCGWQAEPVDHPQDALRATLRLHLDHIPMKDRA